MEAEIKEKEETTFREEKKGKRKWVIGFLNFLMYGGGGGYCRCYWSCYPYLGVK